MHEIFSKTRFNTVLIYFIIFSGLFPAAMNAQFPCTGGMADSEYPCNNIDLMAHISYGSTGATDIWGWVSPTTGEEFAIMGLVNGVTIVNITDPINPVKIGAIGFGADVGSSGWTDIKVKGNYAYVVTEAVNHHIKIFDLTQVENVTNPPITFAYANTFGMVGNGRAHNIAINEELDYSVTVGSRNEASGGLIFHDLSDPLSPTKIGQFSSDGYSHDAVCFIYRGEDVEHIGKEICIGLNEDTYTIVDVTNKSQPVELSRTSYTGAEYTHQGWVTDDHGFLFLNDEWDELYNDNVTNTTTYIFDISDLDNPSSTPYHKFEATDNAIDHNLYIKGSYVYQANYQAGLRVLDISNLEDGIGNDKVTEVAYFDVYPANNATGSQGSWSVYPYFKSGNMVVSSRDRGMFVVRPNLEHFVVDLMSESVKSINQFGATTYELDITSYGGFDGVVDLAVTNLPTGLVATFSPPNLVSSNMVTLTITDNGATPNGNYSLKIEGTTTEMEVPTQQLRVGLVMNSPVLPVTWTNFSATPQTDLIQLDWTTASETNNKGFEVERSLNPNRDFKKIAWIEGKGTVSAQTAYRYHDEDVRAGQTYYYRIKQVDEDGTMAFSKVVSAKIIQTKPTILLTPNPAHDYVTIQLLGANLATPIKTDVMTMDGKVWLSRTDLVGESSFSLSLDGLGTGIYILRIESEKEVLTERLIVY